MRTKPEQRARDRASFPLVVAGGRCPVCGHSNGRRDVLCVKCDQGFSEAPELDWRMPALELERHLAIDKAKGLGWYLDPAINKWRHKDHSAVYVDSPRWGRYALEDCHENN